MDEPTSSLDDREVEVLFGVIRQLKKQGVSIVFVSHKIDELFAICDQITILRDGLTVKSGLMSDINRLELVATMLGRDINSVKGSGSTSFRTRKLEKHDKLIEVSNLKYLPQVRNVSLSIDRSEIVGLAGLLGSGRSETARLIFGADHKQAGEIIFKGKSYNPKQPKDAIELGIGFCTEDRKIEGIIPDLSVRENLTLALLPKLTKMGIVDKVVQEKIAREFIDKLKIKCSSIEQPIKQLSGGNQQKVLLARWLCIDPELLILDEPTRGIDVGAKAEVQSIIGNLADQGLSVLMISSEIEEIFEGAHKAFVLRDGIKVAELSDQDLDESRLLHAMAHGDIDLDRDLTK
jgi:ribose transport system ATP-binding protein